ncbi:DUF4253 domain-containing protein [Actinomadura sp. 6N118]|uniref:DUF4253 domain-containing protein n=1 Tax=Actinomadura sp. 6N118 TaxID=3375151 RepID=UPI00379C8036
MSIAREQIPDGLPPGRLFTPASGNEPVLWISDEPLDPGEAGARWAESLARHPSTSLWPLLLGGMEDGASLRPWKNGEFAPSSPELANGIDVQEMLASAWEAEQEDIAEFELDVVAPFDRDWPGLAPAGEPTADPDERVIALATTPNKDSRLFARTGWGPFLGLVTAADGADAISACGWLSETPCEDVTAMVRSWQQRFGVRVSAVGFSAFVVTVAWPPRTEEHARQVAMEHYAFCSDLRQEYEDFDEYATSLIDAPTWWMWWD